MRWTIKKINKTHLLHMSWSLFHCFKTQLFFSVKLKSLNKASSVYFYYTIHIEHIEKLIFYLFFHWSVGILVFFHSELEPFTHTNKISDARHDELFNLASVPKPRRPFSSFPTLFLLYFRRIR